MRTRRAAWPLLLALALPAGAQAPPAGEPDTEAPATARDKDPAAEAPAPERFLPTDRIPPDSVISFPADI